MSSLIFYLNTGGSVISAHPTIVSATMNWNEIRLISFIRLSTFFFLIASQFLVE